MQKEKKKGKVKLRAEIVAADSDAAIKAEATLSLWGGLHTYINSFKKIIKQ